MLQPLLSELQRAMEAVSFHANSAGARDFLLAVDSMVERVLGWVKDLPAIEPTEVAKLQVSVYILPLSALIYKPLRLIARSETCT
jgi:hypothetical protein